MMTAADLRRCFDVVILGGGPAGCAAGMTLLKREGVAVAVVEASDYSSPRIGESLTPGIRPLLEYLKVWEEFRDQQSLDSFGSEAAWGSPELQSLDYMFTLHGTGWGLNRARFDQMLAKCFRDRGGTILTDTRFVQVKLNSNAEWEVHVCDTPSKHAAESRARDGSSAASDGSPIRILRAKYVIDATGRRGRFVRKLGIPRTIHDRLVGVACIGQMPDGAKLTLTTQVEACQYGWWYTSPVPSNRVSIVLMSDADIVSRLRASRAERWRLLLDEMNLTRERVRGVKLPREVRVFSSVSSCLRQVGGENWAAVGDAVASHDPLSSTGIPHAIGSGVHGALTAANALYADGKMLPAFQESIHGDFHQYLQTHWRYYQRESRWPDSLFWKRRRTPVHLDARATIACVEPFTRSAANEAVHLPFSYQRQLCVDCEPGRLAHEVVRAFSQAHPEVSDQQIILGLQELVQSGQVELASRGAGANSSG